MVAHLLQPGTRWIDAALILAALAAVFAVPRCAPYIAVAGIMLQTSAVHYSSDLDVLLGVFLGLAPQAKPWRGLPLPPSPLAADLGAGPPAPGRAGLPGRWPGSMPPRPA